MFFCCPPTFGSLCVYMYIYIYIYIYNRSFWWAYLIIIRMQKRDVLFLNAYPSQDGFFLQMYALAFNLHIKTKNTL